MKSLRQQICDILATGCFTVADVADSLGVQSGAGVKRVYDAVWLLAKEGRVAAAPDTTPEVWHLVDPKVSVQQRLWRACVLKSQKGPFTVADLVPIVQGQKGVAVSRDYAKRYVRWLWATAYLMRVGFGRDGERVYQIIPGREHDPAPHWNRRAEKRKSRGQGSGAGDQEEKTTTQAFLVPEELQKFAANMRQAFADFYQGLRNLAPYFPQVEPILLEMEADLDRIAKEQGHGEPADGHH